MGFQGFGEGNPKLLDAVTGETLKSSSQAISSSARNCLRFASLFCLKAEIRNLCPANIGTRSSPGMRYVADKSCPHTLGAVLKLYTPVNNHFRASAAGAMFPLTWVLHDVEAWRGKRQEWSAVMARQIRQFAALSTMDTCAGATFGVLGAPTFR